MKTNTIRTIPQAIYCVSPDGKSAVAPDFRRINDVRPGYGYAGLPDPDADLLAPTDSGIFHVDFDSGHSKLIISLADIARLGVIPNERPGIKHYFNHLLFSPDGSRFIALHRWRYPDGSRLTRLITAKPDGSDIRVIIPNGYASHFIWRDSRNILSQSRNWLGNSNWSNFLFEDKEGGIGPASWSRRARRFRSSQLLAGERVDLERHVSHGKGTAPNTAPVPRQNQPPHRSRSLSSTEDLHRRMASRHASSVQPRRPLCLHRCAPRRRRTATPLDRYQRSDQLTRCWSDDESCQRGLSGSLFGR